MKERRIKARRNGERRQDPHNRWQAHERRHGDRRKNWFEYPTKQEEAEAEDV